MRIPFLLIMLVCVTAEVSAAAHSAEEIDLFIDNTSRMALRYEFLDKIVPHGVNEAGDEVIATVKEGVNLEQFLKSSPAFTADIFPSDWSHEGCEWSYRSISSPSLQVTGFADHIELDIDRWCPRWMHPMATLKHLYEMSHHRVTSFLTRRFIVTSQRSVEKALNKQKYPVLVTKQARAFSLQFLTVNLASS